MTTNQLITKIGRQRVLTALANVVCQGGGASSFADLSGVPGDNAALAAALALKANLASPALTGTPTAPLAAAGTNTTQLATTSFVQQELNTGLTTVSITEATVLDDTAFGKVHLVTGTSAGYNLTLPTPGATNYGKMIYIKGGSPVALTKVVTLIGTIGIETNVIEVGPDGEYLLESVVGGYRAHVHNSGWTDYTPTDGGFSSLPTIGGAKYCRVFLTLFTDRYDTADGTSNATTKTTTLKYKATHAFRAANILYRNGGAAGASEGLIQTRANSITVDMYTNFAFAAWSSSGGCRFTRVFIISQIDPT